MTQILTGPLVDSRIDAPLGSTWTGRYSDWSAWQLECRSSRPIPPNMSASWKYLSNSCYHYPPTQVISKNTGKSDYESLKFPSGTLWTYLISVWLIRCWFITPHDLKFQTFKKVYRTYLGFVEYSQTLDRSNSCVLLRSH